jgi:hypothetical protein
MRGRRESPDGGCWMATIVENTSEKENINQREFE